MTIQMDMEYIKNQQVIERYLQDRLSSEEQAAFEALYLSSPELLDELEAAEQLQAGLKDLAALERAPVRPQSKSRLMSVISSPGYAIAATVMLMISLGFTGALYQSQPDSAAPATTVIQPLITTRNTPGSGEVNQLHLDDQPHNFVLLVDPGFTPYAQYRVTVLQLKGGSEPTPIWQNDQLQPGYQDMLAISLPAESLMVGRYRVQVEGVNPQASARGEFEAIHSVTFQVNDIRE